MDTEEGLPRWNPGSAGGGSALIFDHEAVFVGRSPGVSNCHVLGMPFHEVPYGLDRFVAGLTTYDNRLQIAWADRQIISIHYQGVLLHVDETWTDQAELLLV